MGLLSVLLVVFITLKLVGIIDWSWWAVMAPIYPAIVVWLIVAVVTALSLRGEATRDKFRPRR